MPETTLFVTTEKQLHILEPLLKALGNKIGVRRTPVNNYAYFELYIEPEALRYPWSRGEMLVWDFLCSLVGLEDVNLFEVLNYVDPDLRRTIGGVFARWAEERL